MWQLPAQLGPAVVVFALAVLSAGVAVRHALVNSGDTQWSAARVFLVERVNPYTRYLEERAQPTDRPSFVLTQKPNYFVSGYWLLWPLALVDWPMARLLWLAANAAFTALWLWSVQRLLGLTLPQLYWTAALLLISLPWRNLIGVGQHTLMVLAAFGGALLAERRGRVGWAGLLLAVAWFKYSVTLPLSLIFLLRGRWRPLLIAAGVHLALTLASAVWLGETPAQLVRSYLAVVQLPARLGRVDLFALAARWGWESPLWPTAVACAALIGVGALIWRAPQADEGRVLALLSLLACLLLPHLIYDYTALTLLAADRLRRPGARSAAVLVALTIALTWYGVSAVRWAAPLFPPGVLADLWVSLTTVVCWGTAGVLALGERRGRLGNRVVG